MKLRFLGLLVGWCLVIMPAGVLAAEDGLAVGMSISSSEVKPGGSVTYNIAYNNQSQQDYTGVQLTFNLPLTAGLSFLSSSQPVEMTGNVASWRLSDLPAGSPGGLISLTLQVGSDYSAGSVSASSSLTAVGAKGQVAASSSPVTFSVVSEEPKPEEKPEEKTEDKTKSEETKPDESTTKDLTKETDLSNVDLQADGVSKIDLKSIVGVAKLSEATNVNRWDSRYLILGGLGISLILIIGIVAFFIGRRVR